MPFKVKLQAYDHERGEDIVTFLAEFESIAKHAKWSDELKVLQLRTLLTGEARYVATQACGNYLELRKGLIDRFGKRPHEHFVTLVSLTKESTETYTIVEAAEDYIPANVQHQKQKNEAHLNKSGKNNNMNIHNTQQQAKLTSTSDQSNQKNRQCYRCNQWGHIARHCPTDDMKHRSNPATCFVKPSLGQRLISETRYVNGREIMFVKDTGSDMTLIREDLVDKSCKLEGHKVTLYTAVGQPFTAQLAVVNIETKYYKGPAHVGLVSNLAVEALMGMDILGKKGSFIVTRSMAKGLDSERTVEFVNNSIETADTDQREDIEMGNLSSMNADMLSKLQLADISLQSIKEKSFASREEAEEEPMSFFWENDILRRKWQSGDGSRAGEQIVVPAGLRKMVMELAHDRPLAGHLGLEKTKERILQSFFLPGVFSDVKRYCISCHECQKTAKRTAGEKAPMVCPPVITEPFSEIAMDIAGPLARTKSGHKYILTVVDDATRYPEAFPLKDMEATSVDRALIKLFSLTTTPYHPQANGKVERFNGTLKSMLRKFCTNNNNEWDEMLPFLLFAYREVPHEETGFAPFEMLYGWPVRGPMQILQGLFMGEEDVRKSTVEHVVKMREKLADIGALVKENLLDRQKKIKALYDLLILLPSSLSKMKAQWHGPYRVVRKINDVNYQASVPGRQGTVTYHINLLRKYKRAVLMTTQGYYNDGVDVDYHPRAGKGDAGVKLGVNLSKEQREDIINLCDEFEDVLTTRPEDGLTIKPSKCEFGAAEIECLGHIIGGGQIKTDDNKIKAMHEFPLPTTKKGIHSFLGMVGYYRKFIKNFAEVAVPLTSMTQKGRPNILVWTEDAVRSFKVLKDALTKAPVLIAPDFSRKFIVQTDASDTAVGAVLSQTLGGEEHAVAYLSRKLLPREQKYATIEKE
ncbi:hypothetical protein ACJMK2_031474 [Sinanodonta woodiana]|uniref:Uncharacterized protein n=1 Tax=Sinanodonta woodiana TaxID=1069815 RepID=A0ABD3X0C2_SINWO